MAITWNGLSGPKYGTSRVFSGLSFAAPFNMVGEAVNQRFNVDAINADRAQNANAKIRGRVIGENIVDFIEGRVEAPLDIQPAPKIDNKT
jgi:hypothetical protein